MNSKENVSPYLSGGVVISIPIQYKRSLTLIETNGLLNGLPIKQELKTKFPKEVGFFLGLGMGIRLSPKMRLNINGQIEAYSSSLSLLSFVSEEELNGLDEHIKVTPETLLLVA